MGQTLMEWEVDESIGHKRGFFWYISAITVGTGLLIYSVITANFLFTLIILMLALIIYLSVVRGPQILRFMITEAGVKVGTTFYPYRDISEFFFIYEPPEVKNLHFRFKDPLRPRIYVDLDNQNPNEVRAILGQFILEDFSQDEEPFSDFLGRILKI